MSNLNRHPVRRAAVGVLAGTLAFTGGAIAAGISPATAVEGFAFERLAGTDRYGTAADIAANSFPDGATTAIIARGDEFADALAANYLAGVLDAPVLLTATDSLPAITASALASLGVQDVVIVGGFNAVSSAVQAELDADYGVTRLGGNDRYLTAELIANAAAAAPGGTVGELNGLRTAILASGQEFADALAAGPIAFAGNHPVLITRPGDLPASTADVLTDLDIQQVVIVGETAAVSADVEATVEQITGADAIRLGGQTRYETATEIAATAYELFGFDQTHVNLARGDDFADALAGGPHGGREAAPIILTPSQSLAPATEAFLEANSATLVDGHIFGGVAAVSADVQAAAEAAAQGDVVPPESNQTFMVMPSEAATLNVVRADTTNDPTDDRMYTVTTPAAGATHQIQLVPAENVTVDENGVVTFADADGNDRADFGDVAADIIAVNSVAVTRGARATAVPVAGTITFTIDGEAAESVVPVVFFDADNDTALDLGADDMPVEAEPFGVGGMTTYINPAAESVIIPAGSAIAVQSVDEEANRFDAANLTFSYDANDTFRIAGLPVTLDQFETALSSGDTVYGTYAANPELSSTFELNDLNPPAPTAVAAETGDDSNDIVVGAAFTAGAMLDAVVIQRAPVTGGTDEGADGTVGTYATIATPVPTAAEMAAGVVTYTDVDVAPGLYRYRVALSNDGDQSEFVETTNELSVAPGPDQTQPTATDARLVEDNGFAGVLDTSDVFVVRADEALTAPGAGATLRIEDANGTVADLVNTTNATFALNPEAIPATDTGPNAGAPANTVLTVTVTGAPIVVSSGTVAGVQYPAAIVNTAGIADTSGNRLNLATGDLVIDSEEGAVAQNLVSAQAGAGTLNMLVTYQNPVLCSSVAVTDFTFTLTGGGEITPVSVTCEGTTDATLLFTFQGTAFSNETGTVAVAAGAVAGADGAAQPADTVSFTTVTV